jgi:hypothetical protein
MGYSSYIPPEVQQRLKLAPHFDGVSFRDALDRERVRDSQLAVGLLIADGEWWAVRELAREAGHAEATVRACLRDLHLRELAGHGVDRRRTEDGRWQYRVCFEGLSTWDVEAETPSRVWTADDFPVGFAGFVCWSCRAPIDDKGRGEHEQGCPNEWMAEDADAEVLSWSRAAKEARAMSAA